MQPNANSTNPKSALTVKYHKAEHSEQEDTAVITGLHEPEATPISHSSNLPLPQRKTKSHSRKFSTQALHPLRALTHMKTLHRYEINPATDYVERQNTTKARRQLFPMVPPTCDHHGNIKRKDTDEIDNDSATTLQQTPTPSPPEDNNRRIFKWSWKTFKYISLPAPGCSLKTNCTI